MGLFDSLNIGKILKLEKCNQIRNGQIPLIVLILY